jgi:heme oxygenase
MAARPFASRASYARFLRMQYRFHLDLAAVYESPELAGLIPDLSGRNRMSSVTADLNDMGVALPDAEPNGLRAPLEWPAGLGWLYVAEGSKLGAAILFKLAADLGLDERFGARHLVGFPEGRARHWREFTGVLDNVSLSSLQEEQMIAGARMAFDCARAHAELELHAGSR